jgi:hypothetical protein
MAAAADGRFVHGLFTSRIRSRDFKVFAQAGMKFFFAPAHGKAKYGLQAVKMNRIIIRESSQGSSFSNQPRWDFQATHAQLCFSSIIGAG